MDEATSATALGAERRPSPGARSPPTPSGTTCSSSRPASSPRLVRPPPDRRADAVAGRRRQALPRRRPLRRLPQLRARAPRRGRGRRRRHRRRGRVGLGAARAPLGPAGDRRRRPDADRPRLRDRQAAARLERGAPGAQRLRPLAGDGRRIRRRRLRQPDAPPEEPDRRARGDPQRLHRPLPQRRADRPGADARCSATAPQPTSRRAPTASGGSPTSPATARWSARPASRSSGRRSPIRSRSVLPTATPARPRPHESACDGCPVASSPAARVFPTPPCSRGRERSSDDRARPRSAGRRPQPRPRRPRQPPLRLVGRGAAAEPRSRSARSSSAGATRAGPPPPTTTC